MIIGLNGYKEVGKDTVGKYLVHEYDFTRLAFADKVKEAAAILLGVSVEWIEDHKSDPECVVWVSMLGKEITLRHFLQRMGTEVGRNLFGEGFWIQQLYQEHMDYQHGNIVITDARFENELEWIKRQGGYNIKITRPGHEPDGHASEVDPGFMLIDAVIDNNTTIEHLYHRVDSVVAQLRLLEALDEPE